MIVPLQPSTSSITVPPANPPSVLEEQQQQLQSGTIHIITDVGMNIMPMDAPNNNKVATTTAFRPRIERDESDGVFQLTTIG